MKSRGINSSGSRCTLEEVCVSTWKYVEVMWKYYGGAVEVHGNINTLVHGKTVEVLWKYMEILWK